MRQTLRDVQSAGFFMGSSRVRETQGCLLIPCMVTLTISCGEQQHVISQTSEAVSAHGSRRAEGAPRDHRRSRWRSQSGGMLSVY